jgi:hypothetical protein
MKNKRKQLAILLSLLAALAVAAWAPVDGAPLSGKQEDSPYQLLEQLPKGVQYDPQQGWYFYGIPYEQAAYYLPGGRVDLLHVTFLRDDGASGQVWVASGLTLIPSAQTLAGQRAHHYLPRGPWVSPEEAWQKSRHLENVLKISISNWEGGPSVSKDGVNWSQCREDGCYYGYFFDFVNANGLSNRFIRSEQAPSWYPWGFLFWEIEVIEMASIETPTPDSKQVAYQ